MRKSLWMTVLAAFFAPFPAHAGWQAVEKIEPYAISGDTGIALYRSIGEKGPKIGTGRTVAVTDFDLKWTRDYRPMADGGCTLASAVPRLVITYRLPRPAGKLPPATQRRWEEFIAGIHAHERTHGIQIVEMVKKLEAFSVGLTVAADPGCRKIRQAMVEPFRAISNERVAQSRAFDREEMKDGGNIHRLILRLVNGD